jgi:hypothetical protein
MFIDFLRRREPGFQQAVASMGQGGKIGPALQGAYGKTVEQLWQQWHAEELAMVNGAR